MARMYDLIRKKQLGRELSEAETDYLAKGIFDGSIPDYQISALLMAIYYSGMSDSETIRFTTSMIEYGAKVDLSGISGKKVDKHSTGGVGDKITLIAAPIVAAASKGRIIVPKLAGRGLGYTGGTLDKLESVPGLRTSLSAREFESVLSSAGVCIAGASSELSPVERKLYSLRDVTATMACYPLIASSIVSRFYAAGGDCLVLDIKCGGGSFAPDIKGAKALAELIIKVARSLGKRASALVTDMSAPLGRCIGNSLELSEAIAVLSGSGDKRLTDLSLEVAAEMLFVGGMGERDECLAMAKGSIADCSALDKLREMVVAMGGDGRYISDPSLFEESKISALLASTSDGYICDIDAGLVGEAAALLGAGRSVKDAAIDHRAGIVLAKSIGDPVKEGEALATIYTGKLDRAQQGMELLYKAITVKSKKPHAAGALLCRVDNF